MSQWNGFDSLDLSGVEEEQGRKTLSPGNYVCVITDVEIQTAQSGGKYLEVTLTEPSLGQMVMDRITVHNKSQQAVDIGLTRLKTLLTFAAHPNPDKPGDVSSMKGLKVGVRVEQGDNWKDKEGNVRPGGGQPRKYGAYFSATDDKVALGEQAPAPKKDAAATANKASDFNDEIPF